jgi:hypothetical protein
MNWSDNIWLDDRDHAAPHFRLRAHLILIDFVGKLLVDGDAPCHTHGGEEPRRALVDYLPQSLPARHQEVEYVHGDLVAICAVPPRGAGEQALANTLAQIYLWETWIGDKSISTPTGEVATGVTHLVHNYLQVLLKLQQVVVRLAGQGRQRIVMVYAENGLAAAVL